jgi:KDO II ethanolaminephosphotransferase
MILLSLYTGIFLNSPVFLHKAQLNSELGFPVVFTDILFATLICWALLSLASLFGNRILKIAGISILLISSIAAYYMWFFHVVIGYGIIQATFGTEFSLVRESIGYSLFVFLAVFAIIPALYFLRKPIVSHKSWYIRYLLRGVFIAIAIVGLKGVNSYYHNFRILLENGRMAANPFGVAAHSYLPSNWLAGSAMALANNLINLQLEKNLQDPDEIFNFTETANLDDLYLVFVIGESARYDRMSLMGADRETTPLLQKEKNVIGYKGTSCNTITKLSLDGMFVRKGGVEEKGEPIQQFVHEQNIFMTLKKLGFSLDLLAMQAETGFYNKVGADSYKIREEIGAAASQKGDAIIDDYLLVEETRQSIEQHPQGRHVVLLHTNGSHYLYTNRYPRNFAKFRPECTTIDAGCSKEKLLNSYDNSILYTDYILSSLIEVLRDKKALLIYASDHGESIGLATSFHGTPKHIAPVEQRNIPIILWASDDFLAVPQLAAGFKNAQKKQLMDQKMEHEEIFESILGCLGYQSATNGIRPENNWCSPVNKSVNFEI